ncbi:ATP-binding protein, partial [Salmonella enterica]|nr:ATP-binding protein [Salmonella enterica]
QTFQIDGKKLEIQSDGTNSFKYIEIFLSLLISLTRRDYITPIVFIDEPEIGLHPKKSEQLIENLYEIYMSFKKSKEGIEQNKYATPYPNIFMSTHSPNILKSVVKEFGINQQVLHFSMLNENTNIRKMNSTYDDHRFLNIFNDNEARLFFSEFIFFVEGVTEQELFSNKLLTNK